MNRQEIVAVAPPAAFSNGRRSKQRDVHNDDAVRRLPEFLRFFLPLAVESHGVLAHPLPRTGESGHSDTSSQSKTHSIESQEVRYRWHPWYGRAVWIHEDLEKHGEGIRRCRSENNVKARPLELPAWMFDEERCRSMEIRSAARVDCKALQRLKELLKQRKSQTGRDGVVEGQHRLGGADAEASKSLSTSTAGSISSHGEEAGLAKPTIGNSTKNAEAFGATVESTWRESAREQSKGGRR